MPTWLKTAGSVAILLLGLSVVAWKETHRATTATAVSPSGSPQVVLFANLAEEDEAEGCGAIIHAVRASASRGLRTEEIDARNPGDRPARYHLLSAPAVVLLDAKGAELRRFEGESPATVQAIRAALGSLPAR